MNTSNFLLKIMICFVALFLFALPSGCVPGKIRFIVSPFKSSNQIKEAKGLAAKREILFPLDEYSMLIVEKNEDGVIIPVRHYRPQHTSTNKVYPLSVTWSEPLHISTPVIIDNTVTLPGIAIKLDDENVWRVYWMKEDVMEKAVKEGVVYLPPLNQLPTIDQKSEYESSSEKGKENNE